MKNPMEDLTGRQLGPYQLVAPLGKGGMGVVYKAYDTQLARYVAVKVLPPRYVMEPTFVGRFWQEAKAAANLEHPHILPVYAYGEHEGYHYIAMQLVREGSLAGLLQGRPLAPEQMREIITQVGGALDFAHSREVVHRDVKPDNILISRRSGCLLADFGIAKLLESTAHLTQTGASVGTPTYMSPEQIQGEADVDGRSDIYSLGVVLYQMATGRPPFQGNSIQAIQMQHLYQPPPPPHDLNPDLSTAVLEVMLKALAKKPEERYSAASDMVVAMQAAIPRGRASQEGDGAAILGSISPAAGVADQDAETGRPIAAEELGAILDATSALPAPEERQHALTQPFSRVRPAAHPSEPGPTGVTQALPRPPSARLGRIPLAAWAAVLVVVVLAVAGVLAMERRERFLAGGPGSPTASPGASGTPPPRCRPLAPLRRPPRPRRRPSPSRPAHPHRRRPPMPRRRLFRRAPRPLPRRSQPLRTPQRRPSRRWPISAGGWRFR